MTNSSTCSCLCSGFDDFVRFELCDGDGDAATRLNEVVRDFLIGWHSLLFIKKHMRRMFICLSFSDVVRFYLCYRFSFESCLLFCRLLVCLPIMHVRLIHSFWFVFVFTFAMFQTIFRTMQNRQQRQWQRKRHRQTKQNKTPTHWMEHLKEPFAMWYFECFNALDLSPINLMYCVHIIITESHSEHRTLHRILLWLWFVFCIFVPMKQSTYFSIRKSCHLILLFSQTFPFFSLSFYLVFPFGNKLFSSSHGNLFFTTNETNFIQYEWIFGHRLCHTYFSENGYPIMVYVCVAISRSVHWTRWTCVRMK